MSLKIMREVTEWSGFQRQPNHVYLMDGDRVYAVSRWGRGKPEYFKGPLRIDRRHRKFETVKRNRWQFDMSIQTEEPEAAQTADQIWNVIGSKGDRYQVLLHRGVWTCSCPGHGFRGQCRHVDGLKASNPQLV